MERVIVNEGTKVNLYNLFEDLQNYTLTNNVRELGQMIGTYGVNALIVSGIISPSDTSLKPSLYSNSQVLVQGGEGLTASFNFIYNASPGQYVNIAGLTDGGHSLYAKAGYSYSNPVDIMSGFAYGVSGIAQKNSRTHETTTFVWDTNPGVSGIWIADVQVYSGLLNQVTDQRINNVLQFSTNVIPNSHAQNTDTGTTSSTFTIGGVLAQTVPDKPMPPFFIRITDVRPSTTSGVRYQPFDAQLAETVRTGLITHLATVSLKWMYENITPGGSPTTGQIYLTIQGTWTSVLKLSAGDLVGYHLYAKNLGLDWHITANTAPGTNGVCTLTVVPVGHTTQMSSALTFNTGDLFIHPDADRYEIVVTPITETNDRVQGERYEEVVTQPSGAPVLQKTIDLFIGERVLVEIRSGKGNQVSNYALMGAWQYSKPSPYIPSQAYDQNYLVQLPLLVDAVSASATLAATPTANGFTITITPGKWAATATDYELCWTTAASGANFSNTAHQKIVTSQTTYDISTSDLRTYYVAARPLMAGQAVAAPMITTTQSGSAGTVPQDQTIAITGIDLRSFSGTINSYDAGAQAWSVTGLKSPSGSSQAIGDHQCDNQIIGELIIIAGTTYTVNQILDAGQAVWQIVDSSGNIKTSGLGSQTFTINTTLEGRWLYQTPPPSTNMQVVSVHVEQFTKYASAVGAPVLRWYPIGGVRDADSLVLNQPGSYTYTQGTDLFVPQGSSLVVDLWDESLADNTSGFKGTINITWRYTSASNPNR